MLDFQHFNPRTRAGCDCIREGEPAIYDYIFQSTHPCWVRLGGYKDTTTEILFQSTHPCWVRRPDWSPRNVTRAISIHAPVLGATGAARSPAAASPAFQSTHPCWVRQDNAEIQRGWVRYFNPRTRAGCDPSHMAGMYQPFRISIHAPVLGATNRTVQYALAVVHFNPRTRAGCDQCVVVFIRVGADISIHAPVLGATNIVKVNAFLPIYFNPRTRAGCDMARPPLLLLHRYFNPRTRAGCDSAATTTSRRQAGFQSTHPCWVRLPGPLRRLHGCSYFNPRTRAGCDRRTRSV